MNKAVLSRVARGFIIGFQFLVVIAMFGLIIVFMMAMSSAPMQ